MDETSHAFLVRFWLEPREIEGAPPHWRGSVEHLASGERRYVKSSDELMAFVQAFLT